MTFADHKFKIIIFCVKRYKRFMASKYFYKYCIRYFLNISFFLDAVLDSHMKMQRVVLTFQKYYASIILKGLSTRDRIGTNRIALFTVYLGTYTFRE